MEPGTAILVGSILATVGWIVTARHNQKIERRRHTYDLLLRQEDDKSFNTKLIEFGRLKDGGLLSGLNTNNPLIEYDQLDELLDYYEFLAAAVWCGDVDEKLLKLCQKSRIIRLFEGSEEYIKANRKTIGQDSMWRNFQALARRW